LRARRAGRRGCGALKRVVSISLGSSSRDHRTEVLVAGERFVIQRMGTDGDLRLARQLLLRYDGQVDAIGLGGMALYVGSKRKYPLRQVHNLIRGITKTPVVDGRRVKATLELRTVDLLEDRGLVRGRKILFVMSMDRPEMARALAARGATVILGDAMFGLGLPIPLRSFSLVEAGAALVMPVLSRCPVGWLYPLGRCQEEARPRSFITRYLRWAEVIAGDFHYLRRRLPGCLPGKVVVTQTITQRDIELLRRVGVSLLITTTPYLGGRAFAANCVEAVLVALAGKPPQEISGEEFRILIDRAGFHPAVLPLGEMGEDQ